MAERSRTDRLVRRLQEMQMNTPDVEATAIVSVDGLTIASSLPGGVEELFDSSRRDFELLGK